MAPIPDRAGRTVWFEERGGYWLGSGPCANTNPTQYYLWEPHTWGRATLWYVTGWCPHPNWKQRFLDGRTIATWYRRLKQWLIGV